MRFAFAECVLDSDSYVLTRDGAPVPVEPQVFDLLALLARNPGKLVTKDRLVEEIWQGRIVSEATIAARINAARKAVGDDGKAQAIIRTVPRRGIELIVPVQSKDALSAPTQTEAKQTIRYTTSRDGTGIAYAVSGSGPPLLLASHHVTNLELDWASPIYGPTFEKLGAHYTLIRYDMRGTGLSDFGQSEAGIEAHMDDVRAVIDAAGLGPLPILATLNAVPVAIRLAAEDPALFSRMVLMGGYARGRAKRGAAPVGPEHDPFVILMDSGGWGDPDNAFMRAWMSMAMPSLDRDQATDLIRHIGASCPKDHLLENRYMIDSFDVRDVLKDVRVPTLVLHGRNVAVHPLEEARIIAAGIPGAELKMMETNSTILHAADPIWEEQTDAILSFLAEA